MTMELAQAAAQKVASSAKDAAATDKEAYRGSLKVNAAAQDRIFYALRPLLLVGPSSSRILSSGIFLFPLRKRSGSLSLRSARQACCTSARDHVCCRLILKNPNTLLLPGWSGAEHPHCAH